jgi:G3E family GTPase
MADVDELEAAEAWLDDVTDATVLRAPLPTAVLLGPASRPLGVDYCPPGKEPAPGSGTAEPQHADHVTLSRRLDGPIGRPSIETWTRARPSGVVRAKGLVRVDDRPNDRTVLQICGSSTMVSVDGPWDDGEDAVVAIALPGTPRAALVKWLNLLG